MVPPSGASAPVPDRGFKRRRHLAACTDRVHTTAKQKPGDRVRATLSGIARFGTICDTLATAPGGRGGHDPDRLHRRRQRRVHAQPARRHPDLPGAARRDIVLHDIDADRLATAEGMARWTNGAVGAAPTIETHLDRRAALDGADFAVNTIQVGGIAATRLDFDMPAQLRPAPDDQRHDRRRRRLPRPAHDPGAARHRRRHGRGVPRRAAAQLHQPDGDERPGLRTPARRTRDRRPLPLDPEHEPADRRVRRRAVRGGRRSSAPA